MIETEQTPNPDTLKFLPGKKVSEVGPIEFLKSDKNITISLANKILSLKGTSMVFFGEDFITVKKELFNENRMAERSLKLFTDHRTASAPIARRCQGGGVAMHQRRELGDRRSYAAYCR